MMPISPLLSVLQPILVLQAMLCCCTLASLVGLLPCIGELSSDKPHLLLLLKLLCFFSSSSC